GNDGSLMSFGSATTDEDDAFALEAGWWDAPSGDPLPVWFEVLDGWMPTGGSYRPSRTQIGPPCRTGGYRGRASVVLLVPRPQPPRRVRDTADVSVYLLNPGPSPRSQFRATQGFALAAR